MSTPDDLARDELKQLIRAARLEVKPNGGYGYTDGELADALLPRLASVVSRRDADLRTRIEATAWTCYERDLPERVVSLDVIRAALDGDTCDTTATEGDSDADSTAEPGRIMERGRAAGAAGVEGEGRVLAARPQPDAAPGQHARALGRARPGIDPYRSRRPADTDTGRGQ